MEQPLAGQADVAGDQHRRCAAQACRDQLAADLAGGGTAHVEGGGRARIGERGPVEHERLLAAQMRGDELHPSRLAPERERDPGRGCGGAGGGDARADAHPHPGRGERADLLGRAAEDRRVAALQPHHPLAVERGFDEQRVDRALILRMPPRSLADGHAPHMLGDQRQHAGPDQRVVEHHARRLQQPLGLAGEQVGVPGARTDQPDFSGPDHLIHWRHSCSPRGSGGSRGGTSRNWSRPRARRPRPRRW